jgi:hypothetical protein
MPNNHMPPLPPDNRQEPPGTPPAVVIHVRGWHLQIDALPRARWLVIWAATMLGSIAGAWGPLAR